MSATKSVSITVSDLTLPERLRIQRIREGWTVAQAAKRHKVKISVYRAWEHGKTEEGAPTVAIGNLTTQEKCVLMRLRSKKTTLQVAKEVKCCRLWLRMMEDGRADVTRLQEFWRIR